MTREIAIEEYLVACAEHEGWEVRKVKWPGRNGAPDRVIFAPNGVVVWVECKSPETIRRFPSDARERAQEREHQRMRAIGQWVEVLGTRAGVDAIILSIKWHHMRRYVRVEAV